MTGPRPAELLRHLATEAATDADLLRRFASARDGAAFAELVRRHGPVVLAACRRGVRHHHDADDAFQAVFLVLARRAGAVRRPELLGSWLYRVAVRVTGHARRAAARRRAREVQGVDVREPAAPPAAAPDDLGPVLDEELGALPAWYRDAVVLCDLRELSRTEAAAALGIPLGTLASRLDAGRKKLAARLARRGVTLSVAAVLVEGRAAAVPDSLLTKTCGLVADWSAGGAVPAAVLRLARGGSTMRTVLLGGMLTVSLAAGAVLAAGLGGQPAPSPPAPPPPEPVVAAAQPEAKPAPVAGKDQPPVKLGPPRLRRTANLRLSTAAAVAWSRDGTWLAVTGPVPADPSALAAANALVVLAPADPKATPGQLPIPAQAGLVGFTSDGARVLAFTRETGLISGEYLLHRMTVSRGAARDKAGLERPVVLAGDGDDAGAVPDGAEQLTVTGPQDVRFLLRGPSRVTVWHADIKFDGRWPLGSFDGSFSTLHMTPDGRRVVALAGQGVVEGYDAITGKKLWATDPAVRLPDVKLAPRAVASGEDVARSSGFALGLSEDGRRAVVARGPLTPLLVLDLDTGKALPLAPDLAQVIPVGPVAVSGDGRLAALSYATLIPLDGKERPKGGPAAGATHALGPTKLTVWDTATGEVVRTWDGRAVAVAFHPGRPVLAVLEAYAGGTRLGLWDFAVQP